MAAREEDPGRPCSRIPSEFCDGATLIWTEDGTSRREAARTPRAFCEPCRSRIITCLEELPPAYERLAAAIGDPPRTGMTVRAPFGPREPVRSEIDALMRVTAVILHGWEARVRGSRLRLAARPATDILDPGSVKDASKTIATHVDVLLALQPGWMTRTFTFPPGKPGARLTQEATCRRCSRRIGRVSGGRRDRWYVTEKAAGPVSACAHEPHQVTSSRSLMLIPADIEAEIGDEEITGIGDGWVQVYTLVGGAKAGNEVIALHYRARRILGETKEQPESFDGMPCRACDHIALEHAEPPSDPQAPAKHSRCADCGDELDRDEFDQWAGMYASWAPASIRVCRRCSRAEPKHEECCWSACACTEGPHPRRRAAA